MKVSRFTCDSYYTFCCCHCFMEPSHICLYLVNRTHEANFCTPQAESSHFYIPIYIYPTRCNVTQFIYIWKLRYMFRVVPPPIIRSAYNCIYYSISYLSHRYCHLPLLWKIAITVWQIPDAVVDTVLCAPDDGWSYHPKHVQQFPDKNKFVMLHLVGYRLEYIYDTQTHKR
jgi:hypothetical protein